jgi:hypothetical protein
VNGVNGDPNKTEEGKAVQTLQIPEITRRQEAYVRKVMDTVNDLDNVLYEVTNESEPQSTEWQYHIINFIHQYEAGKPKQHPVGMTFQWGETPGRNLTLFNSPADWISPNPEGGYDVDPPAADGSKVILSDTDHIWGVGGTQQENEHWVWKSFTRGLNPIFMDLYEGGICCRDARPRWQTVNAMLGQTRTYATKMNLAAMVPWNALASTRYCLAHPGSEYLVYQPIGGSFWLNLVGTSDTFTVEWLNVGTGKTTVGEPASGGAIRTFVPPFSGPAVLYLKSAGRGR